MIVYTLINYFDVWGNQKDGYEVNNLCKETGNIYLSDRADEKEIVKAIKEFGFFKKSVRSNMVTIENLGDMIEIRERKTGKPVCRLEPQTEYQPLGVYTISNSGGMILYEIEDGITDRVLVGYNDELPKWYKLTEYDESEHDLGQGFKMGKRAYYMGEFMKIGWH